MLWEPSKLEPELNAGLPRLVALRNRTLVAWFAWIAAGCAVVWAMIIWSYWWTLGLGFWALMIWDLNNRCRRSRLLVSEGTAVFGTVIDRHEVEHWAASEYPYTYTVHVYTVAYDLPDGRKLTISVECTTEEFYRDQKLTVLYLPQSPEEAILYRRAVHRALSSRRVLPMIVDLF